MGLFKPAWMVEYSEGTEKALKAVDKLTNQSTLYAIINNAPLYDVRMAAVKKLTNQSQIIDIVNNISQYSDVRVAAIERISDQTVVTDLYKDSKKREQEMKELTKKDYFNRKAIIEREGHIRYAAVKKMTNQSILADIARTDSDKTVSCRAVEQLNDQQLLAHLVVSLANVWETEIVRREAVKKMTDQTALANIALHDDDSGVRSAALKKLTDQTAILNVAKHENDYFTLNEALSKMTDSFVFEVILTAESESVRITALRSEKIRNSLYSFVNQLTEQSALLFIGLHTVNSNVRELTLKKITDPDECKEIRKVECECKSGKHVWGSYIGSDSDSNYGTTDNWVTTYDYNIYQCKYCTATTRERC